MNESARPFSASLPASESESVLALPVAPQPLDSQQARREIHALLSAPPFLLAQVLIWGYVAARAAHFLAYVTAQLHDVRATFWSLSSISVIAMVGYTLVQLLQK